MLIATVDLVALVWFGVCWFGYAWFAEWRAVKVPSLVSARRALIRAWVENIFYRQVRILDSTLLANLLQGSTFFASTTIVILGGLLALLGTSEKALGIVAELPFTAKVSERSWEIKIVLLLAVFIYAFFKFTWSLRQYNLVSILVGSMLDPEDAPADYNTYLNDTAQIASFAGENYNMGLRSYYFGFAVLTWLLNPWLMMAMTAFVVSILYQREFRSRTLTALLQAARYQRSAPEIKRQAPSTSSKSGAY
jgi:uncharacterized membrane protein